MSRGERAAVGADRGRGAEERREHRGVHHLHRDRPTGRLQCRTCKGTGTTERDGGGNCFLCSGTGTYTRYRVSADGSKQAYREEPCRTCDGTGTITGSHSADA